MPLGHPFPYHKKRKTSNCDMECWFNGGNHVPKKLKVSPVSKPFEGFWTKNKSTVPKKEIAIC